VSVELVLASTVDTAARAQLFEAAYVGYFVPVHVDEAALAHIVDAWEIDLNKSYVAMRDGTPIGFANLALRAGLSWIGGVGVVPEERRSGLGRRLMDAVLAEAPGDVMLEVIEQNAGAIRLYEELGFVLTRMLDVWSWRAEPPAATARKAEPRIVERDAPWQRARPNLDAMQALEVDGGTILFTGKDGINVVQLAADGEASARELLSAARARGNSLHFVNAPSEGAGSAALRSLGASLDLRQLEMRLSR
jgi:GNAT superfamily N-acetyltransferase